jgi:carbamoyltransferase
MYILGINSAYHESSACLLKDGVVVAAAEEERFTRKKHGKMAGVHNPHELPVHAIDYCLASANTSPGEIDYIGFSLNPQRRLANKDFPDRVVEGDWGSRQGEELFFQQLCKVPTLLEEMGLRGKFSWIDHHLSHAASTFYLSPFSEAAILTVDGIGETESTVLAFGSGREITDLQKIYYPASIGFLWEKIAKYLGFTEYDSYKVMGLAAYGRPERYSKHMQTLIAPLPNGNFSINDRIMCFRVEDYRGLEQLFGLPRRTPQQALIEKYQDVAAALQHATNKILLHVVEYLYQHTTSTNLCMAGGVALNCISNNVIHTQGPFTNIYIQPAAHDAGTALGAALTIWYQQFAGERQQVMRQVYLGPSFSNEEILPTLQGTSVSYQHMSAIEQNVARLLSEGKIVGWFQGAMEFGPRALGNRSLLADPRDKNMWDILNLKVKHREEFRPLAPSVLDEVAQDWFEIDKPTMASDFMLLTYPAKKEIRSKIPAVVHVDGTSRIQTVRKETNAKYHALISHFFQITGVPLVLNTSFNDNEPIVCTPQDAVATFLRTPEMDYLAIGDFLVSR